MIKQIVISILVFSMLILSAGCSMQPADNKQDYTITVTTAGGMCLSDIVVTVYNGTDMTDLVWRGETSDEGTISFSALQSDEYIAVIEGLPDGYVTQESYPVDTCETVITPEILLEEKEELSGTSYDLGDIIHDFEVTGTDGTEYRLSELLEAKKAVVLNFWYLNCQPCRMEFPYLEEAYQQYNDDIEVLALNPVDGTDTTVAAFAKEMSLSFPMAACDPMWEGVMELDAYPTTVVIDRYGMISMIHKGYITETETFSDIFEYFTSDDYVQSTVKNISDISQKEG